MHSVSKITAESEARKLSYKKFVLAMKTVRGNTTANIRRKGVPNCWMYNCIFPVLFQLLMLMFLQQLPATKSIMHQKYEGTLAVGSALQSSIQLQRRPFGIKQDFCTSLSNIVTSYLQHQHSSCRNPIVTCPPFSLLT